MTTYAELETHAGSRVRLTYPNGFRRAGLLTAHVMRPGVVDLRIDGHGGFPLERATVEVMGPNGRYVATGPA